MWPEDGATHSALSAHWFNDSRQCVLVEGASSSYQLFTCRRVRLVCAAICRFSSSVGYGCWKHKGLVQGTCALRTTGQTSAAHHQVLEEPRAHNVGGVFRQNPPLIFGLLVFAVQQGRKVHVYLDNKNQDRPGEGGMDYMVWILLPRKQRETTNYLSFFFFLVARAETPLRMSPW